VPVTLALRYQNIKLIKCLLEVTTEHRVSCYTHTDHCEYGDEVEDLDNTEDVDLNLLMAAVTPVEFAERLGEFGEHLIHFVIKTCGVYARNISRRKHPHILRRTNNQSTM